MNDEIKEILDRLNNIPMGELYACCLEDSECKIILDYITNLQYKYENQIHRYNNQKNIITNLQKENEELKSKNDILEFRMKENDKMVICERYCILKQRDNYKQRIDKANEYIKRELKEFYDKNKNCKYLTTILELESIEEILGGSDE